MSATHELGPLAPLQGIWEGERGTDLAPSDSPETDRQLATSKFRERMVFEATGRVDNHEQKLFGLRYSTKAWRIGADAPFHEEVGYWLWDAASKLVIRCFMPPRGMTILAGGNAEPDATKLSLEAKAGSEVFGICSSPFLSAEFKTVQYTLEVDTSTPDTLHYEEHMFLKLKGKEELFDHSDINTLRRAQ
ncbi:MAG: FABP family protein [Myxococcales bacterium]|nr:FABP family protein [Myxococcales bacterium]